MDAQARAAAVRLMIFDVDGVLTDGRLYFVINLSEIEAREALLAWVLAAIIACGTLLSGWVFQAHGLAAGMVVFAFVVLLALYLLNPTGRREGAR